MEFRHVFFLIFPFMWYGLKPDTDRTAIQIPTLSVDEEAECVFFNILKSLWYCTSVIERSDGEQYALWQQNHNFSRRFSGTSYWILRRNMLSKNQRFFQILVSWKQLRTFHTRMHNLHLWRFEKNYRKYKMGRRSF